jgi:O-antigen ligase
VIPLLVSIAVLARSVAQAVGSFAAWIPWAAVLSASALLSEHANALHRTLIILTPLLVGIATSTLTVDSTRIAGLRSAIVVFAISAAAIITIKIAMSDQSDRHLFLAPESATMVLLAWVAVHVWIFYRSKVAIAIWIIAVAVPVISVSRAASLVALCSLVFFLAPVHRRARILGLLAGLLVGAAAVFTGGFLDKSGGAGLSLSDIASDPTIIQTSGRTAAWSLLAERIPMSPWVGHGANASQTVLTQHMYFFDHPHNDWLRLLYDYGVLGLSFFLLGGFRQISALLAIPRTAPEVDIAFLSYSAASLFVPYFLLMVTDNVLLYVAYFGNIHFFLIGCAFAARRTATGDALAQNQLARVQL